MDSLQTVIRNLNVRDSSRATLLQNRLDSIANMDSIRRHEKALSLERLRKTVTDYPVILDDDTLFRIFLRLGSFPARERAEAISGRLLRIASDRSTLPDSIRVSANENTTDILYRETILMSVSEADAMWFARGRDELAKEYANAMVRSMTAYKHNHAWTNLLLRSGKVAAIALFLASLIFAVSRAAKGIRRRILASRSRRFKGIKLKSVELLSPGQQLNLSLSAIRLVEIVAYLALLYLCLPLLFAVFPSTRDWAGKPLEWLLTPLKSLLFTAIGYLPNLINILIIFYVTKFLVKIGGKIFDAIERGSMTVEGFYPDWARPTFNIIRFLAYVLMFIAIFPLLPGSNSPIFRGVSVFLGVLFSLGSTSAVSNLVAGLVITYMRPFRVGDRVKLGEVTGDVIEKTMLVTRLRTPKNEDITIPNSTILNGHTVNYTSSSEELGLILNTTVTIGYDAPWNRVHQLLREAALDTGGVLKEPAPFVLQISLDDFYVSYQLNAYTDQPKRMNQLYSDLHQHIQDRFRDAGVEIMSPHFAALREGNHSAIPPGGTHPAPGGGAFKIVIDPGAPPR